MTTRWLAAAVVGCAGLVALAPSARAEDDDCPDLAKQLAASRAAIDASLGDPSKSDGDFADTMARHRATATKLAQRCRDTYDGELERDWQGRIQNKAKAIDTCRQLRVAKADGAARGDIAATGAQGSLAEIQRGALVVTAGECVERLAPYGATLNAHLGACLALCRQKNKDLAKPRTAPCTAGVDRLTAVVGEMETFIDRAATGKEKDVLVDFGVLRQKLARETGPAAQVCERGTVPDLSSRARIADAQAAAIDGWVTARRAFDEARAKKLGWSTASGRTNACVGRLVNLPARDARLEKMLGECRDWSIQGKTLSTVKPPR